MEIHILSLILVKIPVFLQISQILIYSGEICQSRVLQLYRKRLLWLIDFSPEEAPTWPRSHGRLDMIHPEGQKLQFGKHSRMWKWSNMQSCKHTQKHAVPQQGPGISWPVWRSCNGSGRQMESACWGWRWPLWQSQTLLNTEKTNKPPQVKYAKVTTAAQKMKLCCMIEVACCFLMLVLSLLFEANSLLLTIGIAAFEKFCVWVWHCLMFGNWCQKSFIRRKWNYSFIHNWHNKLPSTVNQSTSL